MIDSSGCAVFRRQLQALKMDNLVLSNLFYRKTRTFTTAAGVALGVVLVVLTVGLVHGFLNEQGRRNSAVTAEIIFRDASSGILSVSPTLAIPQKTIDQIRTIEGVSEVVGVGQYQKSGRVIDGIEFDSYTKVSGMRIIEGRAVQSGDEAMIDPVSQRDRKVKVGDNIELLDRQFRVVGIYEPESLGRIKIPISTLQDFMKRPNLLSLVLIKVSDPAKQAEVAQKIKERFPDSDIRLTRDLPILYAKGTPAMQTFLKVVIALAIIISSLVILLAMYTTVTERTRQIGVLKSLGASKAWIAGEIEKEAFFISLIGVLAGFTLAILGRYFINRFFPVTIELEAIWFFYTLVLGIVSGLLGALYPALRAANQDPVKALSYE
jgi:putative ABC transport system permease protein